MSQNNKQNRNLDLHRIRTSEGLNRAIQGELAALELDLAKKLLDLYAIIRQFGMPIDYFKNNPDIRYQVYSHIRKSVQDGYLIGTDLVGIQFKKRVKAFELFISGTDISTIKEISSEMFDRYWITTQWLLTRETATVETDNVKLEKRRFDIEAAYEKVASRAVYTGYNKAVSSKLANTIPSKTDAERATGLTGAFSFKKVFKGGFEKLKSKISDVFGDLLGLNKLQELKPKQVFTTKGDAKVCDTGIDPYNCATLDGIEYEIDDPQKPEMPHHDWCRCLLLPVIDVESPSRGFVP